MRWLLFLVFYVLIAFYGYQAIRSGVKNTWVHYGYGLICLLILGNFLIQWLQPSSGHVLTGAKSYALGFVLAMIAANIVLSLIMFGEDIFRLLNMLYKSVFTSTSGAHLPSRRAFIGKLALGLAAIPFASLLYGMYRGKYNYQVLQYELAFEDLPEAFDGYQITQISDIHSGSFDNQEKIAYAVDLINEQESDALFFTGDLVNNRADEMENWKSLFGKLRAKDGVFSILGNHDYGDYVDWNSDAEQAENLNQLKATQREMGWDLLLNEHRVLERDGQKLAIVGVENWGAGGFVKHGDADAASEGLAAEDFKILLSHDPSYWQEKIKSDAKNYHLTLSGHTHGMQFGIEIPGWFKWSPVQYRYKNWAGIYEENKRYINVNRGFGYLAYPGRVGIWPEISVIKLRKKQATS